MPDHFAVSSEIWSTVFLLPDPGTNRYNLDYATNLGRPSYAICRDGILFLYFLTARTEYRIDELHAKL